MALSEDPKVPAATPLDADIRAAFDLAPGPDTNCFRCGEVVEHPAVYWEGETRIWLHPACALGLSCGLLADVERLWALMVLRAELKSRQAA